MAIRKISQTPPTMASIVDTYSTSTQDGYACDYINELNTYSTDEIRIGTWFGKPVYRKVISSTLNGTYTESDTRYTWINTSLSNINVIKVNFTSALSDRVLVNTDKIYITGVYYITSGNNANKIQIGSSISNIPINTPITLIVEYTKTTD
jgi:hypothetical protein